MKGNMKKTAMIALAGLMAASLSACQGEENATADPSTQAGTETQENGEKTTIRITWWGGQTRHDDTQKVLDKYMESHPDVVFEAIPSGWDGYFDKLSTQAASGAMPDIVQMDYLYISTYAKNQSIADLQPFIDDGTIETADVDEKLLASGEVDGKMAGIALSSSILSVGYNPSVFEAAGLEAPDGSWTWEEYIEANKKIAEATGTESALVAAGVTGDTNLFNYWVRQHGGSLFNEEGTDLGYTDDEITAGYFRMWKDMMDQNIAPDPDEMAQVLTLGQEASPVVTGEAGTMFEWNNYAAKLSSVNDTLHITTPPELENAEGKGLWIKPGMFFSIAETSKVKQECAEFINWFINSEEANDIMMAERGTPVSASIRKHMIDSGSLSAQQVEMFEYVDKAAEISGETPAPDPSGISEINEAFNTAGNTVFYERSTPEEAAAAFREDVREILARNNQ